MSAITVDRRGVVRVGGAVWGRVEPGGSVIVGGKPVGRVDRVGSVGPRGGSVVEWIAYTARVPEHYRTRSAAVAHVVESVHAERLDRAGDYPSSVAPCPCGDLYIDGVCSACDSCSGCAECGDLTQPVTCPVCVSVDGDCVCSPARTTGAVAYGVRREVVSIDRQDYPGHTRATVRVRYTYPDAPEATLRVVFSQQHGADSVWMQAGSMACVVVDEPARFGAFASAPVDWVHSFYADR